MKKINVLLTMILITAAMAAAQTKVEDVKTFTLTNGMKFILVEDHSIPNANIYTLFKVGSRNEYPGITGLSHFFEHMMFNGAKKYGPKQFDRVMEAAGGSNNASTSKDITVYTDWFPGTSLEVMFDLESDRIGHLSLDDKMVESERGVVLSERTTGLANSNYLFLSEQVEAVAMIAHPYRWSVIGYESDIKNWQKSDLQQYFQTYYAPNNAVVVIVGDISFEKVKTLAKDYFEPIPSREPPRPIHTVEPPQLGEKRLTVKREVSYPNLMIVYHIPGTRSDDYYTLEMLGSILGEGKSSRLYRAIVSNKQLATEISSYAASSLDPYLFYIYAVCARDAAPETLEKAIYQEVDKIINEGVTDHELQKVKNSRLMSFYQSMESINGRAFSLGFYEILFGGYEKLFSAPEAYKKITTGDIKTAAAKYLVQSNRTVGILEK